MPLYEFHCYVNKHSYEGIRPVSHSGIESCQTCDELGLGFAFAHRVISGSNIRIPLRAAANDFAKQTFQVADKQTRRAESKARKVQPLR